MKKSLFSAITIFGLLFSLLSTSVIAQQKGQTGIILKQGNYHQAWEIPGGGFGRCFCGQGAYDCLCGFVNYSDFEAPNIPLGQIGVVVSSHVVSGNTLRIKFKEKLKMELKTKDFVQEEAVVIKSDVAKSLGYKSITVLPGKYTIRGGNSLTFNVDCGEPVQTRGWGWVFVVVIVVTVIILWGILGGTLPSTGSNGGIPSGQGCDFCKQLPHYWAGLSRRKKMWMLAWYLWNLAECRRKGC